MSNILADYQIDGEIDVQFGIVYENADGNEIIYPIENPSEMSKLYKEADISAIAYALGKPLKVSEMASAIQPSDLLVVCSGSRDYIDTSFSILEMGT